MIATATRTIRLRIVALHPGPDGRAWLCLDLGADRDRQSIGLSPEGVDRLVYGLPRCGVVRRYEAERGHAATDDRADWNHTFYEGLRR